MNQVPNYFLPLLNSQTTPAHFMDVIGFCLYKGLKLNFSANKKQGYYFGYFAYDEESFTTCDSFKFLDLNNYLFKEQTFLNDYILNNKVIISLYYQSKMKCYTLELKEVKYNKQTNNYEYFIKERVRSNKIKNAFVKMNYKLSSRKSQKKGNSKILYLDRYKYG